MALHTDMLQQHPLAPTAMHHLLEQDANPALWIVALFISIIITLVVLLKSGKPHVLWLSLPRVCRC